MTTARAIREFTVSGDPWPIIDRWAQHQNYQVIEKDNGHRTYKKGKGSWTGARKVEIAATGDRVHVEAFVAASGAARAMSLFILPREITVESGGAKAIVPRKMGRGEVNELLEGLGQQPIL